MLCSGPGRGEVVLFGGCPGRTASPIGPAPTVTATAGALISGSAVPGGTTPGARGGDSSIAGRRADGVIQSWLRALDGQWVFPGKHCLPPEYRLWATALETVGAPASGRANPLVEEVLPLQYRFPEALCVLQHGLPRSDRRRSCDSGVPLLRPPGRAGRRPGGAPLDTSPGVPGSGPAVSRSGAGGAGSTRSSSVSGSRSCARRYDHSVQRRGMIVDLFPCACVPEPGRVPHPSDGHDRSRLLPRGLDTGAGCPFRVGKQAVTAHAAPRPPACVAHAGGCRLLAPGFLPGAGDRGLLLQACTPSRGPSPERRG